jgi:hypothetical protein
MHQERSTLYPDNEVCRLRVYRFMIQESSKKMPYEENILDLILRQSVVVKSITIFKMQLSKVIWWITSKKLGGNSYSFSAFLQPILLTKISRDHYNIVEQ